MLMYCKRVLPKSAYYINSTAYITKHYFRHFFSTIHKTSKQFLNMDSYVWIDMEMTGLDPEKDTVLEVACILTTPLLKPMHDGLHLIIHQPDEVLNSMNEWSLKHHAQTGLTEASKKSTLSLSEADDLLSNYITDHTKGTRYIAGNSVYMDKIFLMKHFPKTDGLLHYRIIDVSSIKILCSNWYPEIYRKLDNKKTLHRAFSDIEKSIQELQNYKDNIFK